MEQADGELRGVFGDDGDLAANGGVLLFDSYNSAVNRTIDRNVGLAVGWLRYALMGGGVGVILGGALGVEIMLHAAAVLIASGEVMAGGGAKFGDGINATEVGKFVSDELGRTIAIDS